MATEIKDIRSKPLYDSTTGKLLGWELSWNYAEPEFGCLETLTPVSSFFEERWFRNSYKAMCRFRSNLQVLSDENSETVPNKNLKRGILRQIRGIEDIDPIDVSDIKTVIYNTEQSKSRIEEDTVIQPTKEGDVIARYIVMVTYLGNIVTKFIGPRKGLILNKKSTNVIDVRKNSGSTVITYAWAPKDFLEPEDSLHAAEMFRSTMVTRVARNADGHTK